MICCIVTLRLCVRPILAVGPGGLILIGVELGRVKEGANMTHLLRKMWRDDEGQDIAEYAVMLAVILVLVVGTIRLVGSNANNVFSATASTLQ